MNRKAKWIPSLFRRADAGQALIEYALILVLVAMALLAALIATGPAIANVFSNTVCNLVGLEDCSPDSLVDQGGGPNSFWLTVTAVAQNPPKEQPIPTNPGLPPTPKPTDGPSPTPTDVTPSPTPVPTKTDAPTATPTDIGHLARFEDPIDHPEWWRVDSSIYLGGEDWWGEYFPNRDLTGSPEPAPKPPRTEGGAWNYEIDKKHKFNINFDWGAGAPLAGWGKTDDFSVRWTRSIFVYGTDPITVSFTIQSIGGVRFWVDSTNLTGNTYWTNRTLNDAPVVLTQTLTPGSHTLKLEYYSGTGDAAVFMDISSYKGNVRDDKNLASGAPSCQWSRITGSQPNTVAWAWKESPAGTGAGFPANMRCNLELRGWVDVSTKTAPKLAFWDVWDLTGGGTVTLQIAEYQAYSYLPDGTVDPASGPKWSSGVSYAIRSGSKNYAWTYNVVDIPNVPSKKIAYRFVLESGAGAGNRRYYVDDLLVDDLVHPKRTFTVCDNLSSCGNYWNMDSTTQMADFLYSARWGLTSNNPAGSTGTSWDISGRATGGSDPYVKFGAEQPSGDARVHSIEFNGQVAFQNISQDGTGGIPDFEGNDGVPMLRFSQAYDIDAGTTLAIQYTRDAYDATPDNWQTVQTLATGAASNPTMQQTEVDLSSIPNWWQQAFRLRFAMLVDGSRTPTRTGWQIDNIVFVRKGIPRYSAYPFCDGADLGSTGTENWLMAGGWGVAQPGAFGSPRSFTDSPGGNYRHGQESWMELKYPLDFNNDTPENLTTWGGNKDCVSGAKTGAAIEPILEFWHKRNLASSEAIYVDIARPAHRTTTNPAHDTVRLDWTPVWSYTYVTRTSTNLAWERAEINLRAAILEVIRARTGVTMDWNTLKTNPNPYDDDFYVRIRLDARTNPAVADGIYVDSIDIRNFSEVSHKLWDVTTGGNGSSYGDNIDTPTEWWLRWRNGGDWSATSGDNWKIADPPMPYWWKAHSGSAAFSDSPPPTVNDNFRTPYRHGTLSILEMVRIIDMTNVLASDEPTLYFWNHYDTGTKDVLRVQVAVQDAARTRQGYDYIFGWGSDTSYGNSSSWEDIGWSKPENQRVDTWVREQVSLKAYAGKRIRVRFVIDALENASNLRDGWYVDDVRIEQLNQRVMPFPFTDLAKNTQNWVTEGLWGLAPDLWKGSGGGPANLGPDTWKAYFMKCLDTSKAVVNCTASRANAFLNGLKPTEADMDAYVSANLSNGKALPKYVSDEIVYDFGSSGRPPGAPLGSAGSAWDNYFAGRWLRTISVLDGEYTFITTSDDGVRMRYEPADNPATSAPYTWNLINNWNDHGRVVDMKSVTLSAGDYNVIVEWYEGSGDAVIIVQAGNNNFSFSDSPRASAAGDVVYSVPYGNSSLLLNGVLNLNKPTGLPSSLWKPSLRYYTYYDLDTGSSANVEVSIDGGLTWTKNNLYGTCPSGAYCSPTITGGSGSSNDWMPPSDWQWRVHDLTTYGNRTASNNFLVVRFRLNTLGNLHDGWWITEITVNN
ncbi:MAG: hypothetical protein HZC41_15710 [Chloroflexi bacterium]|nr:hypothetical protein [Chloroflexota bacterium]